MIDQNRQTGIINLMDVVKHEVIRRGMKLDGKYRITYRLYSEGDVDYIDWEVERVEDDTGRLQLHN